MLEPVPPPELVPPELDPPPDAPPEEEPELLLVLVELPVPLSVAVPLLPAPELLFVFMLLLEPELPELVPF